MTSTVDSGRIMTQWKTDLRALEEIAPEAWSTGWPERAREIVLAVLRDQHATESDLYVAGRLLCDMPRVDDQWALDLLSVVQNRDMPEEARLKAAIPLGPVLAAVDAEGFDEEGCAPVAEAVFHRIQSVLYDVYADSSTPEIVRRRALEAFAHAPEPRLEDAIRAADGSDDAWQVTALRRMFHHDGFEREILESLRSEDLDVRSEAIRAAGPCDLQEAWPYIRAVPRERAGAHKPLLLAAIDSIGHIRPEEAQGLLANLVSSDDTDIAGAAERALAFVLWPLANYDFGDDAQRQ